MTGDKKAQAAAHDVLISAGLAVTPWGAGRAAASVLSKGGAKVFGGALGLGVTGVEIKRAASGAVGAAARAEFEARGLDPKNPTSFTRLPPEVRRKIAAKGAVAALANGASNVAARQIAKGILGDGKSELVDHLIESGLSTLIEEGTQIIEVGD